MQDHAVTLCRLHQRTSNGRHKTDVVALEIDFVGAHDAHHPFIPCSIGVMHSRAKEHPLRSLSCSWSFRVHHLSGFDSFTKKANAPIDLPQPPLAVLIVGVLAAVAIAGSPRHDLYYCRAVLGKQKPVLILEALQPARSDVVRDSLAGLVNGWVTCKPFPHLAFLPATIVDSRPAITKQHVPIIDHILAARDPTGRFVSLARHSSQLPASASHTFSLPQDHNARARYSRSCLFPSERKHWNSVCAASSYCRFPAQRRRKQRF